MIHDGQLVHTSAVGSDRHAHNYNTYFGRQSADYIPGSDFVAVAEGVAPTLTAEEELAG